MKRSRRQIDGESQVNPGTEMAGNNNNVNLESSIWVKSKKDDPPIFGITNRFYYIRETLRQAQSAQCYANSPQGELLKIVFLQNVFFQNVEFFGK
jgi:hypothetical protein